MNRLLFPALMILLIPWISCKNDDNKEPKTAEIVSVKEAPPAPLVLPKGLDTLLPSGRHNWYLLGSRDKKGLFIERTEFPKGYMGQPNVHDEDVYITVISGTAHIGFGNEIDTTKNVTVLGPGSFFKIPADQAHYEWFYAPCIIQLEGIGPQSTFYVTKTKESGSN